jgi:hypothetical protein
MSNQLLTFVQQLRNVTTSVYFDYSSVQAISEWITESLEDCPPSFEPLKHCSVTLQDAVALNRGLGLKEIWNSFRAGISVTLDPEVKILDRLASGRKSALNLAGTSLHSITSHPLTAN